MPHPGTFLISLLGLFMLVDAYDYDEHKNPVTDQRLKLVVIPSPDAPYKHQTLRAVKLAEAEAGRLKRFQVLDFTMDSRLLKKKLSSRKFGTSESALLQWAKTSGADEALVVSVISYKVQKVRIKDQAYRDRKRARKEKGRWKSIKKKKVVRPRLMFNASINIMIKKIRIAEGEVGESREYKKSVQMNTRRQAEDYLFSSFQGYLRNSFRSLYLMETEIIKVEFDKLVLRLGANMGIPKNTLYKIRTRGRTEHVGESEYEFPGEVVALARVMDVGEEASVAYLIRQWDHINIDYQAVEMLNRPGMWRFQGLFGYPSLYMGGGVQYIFNPLGRWNFQLGLQLSGTDDSQDLGPHFGFGFEFALTYRLPVAHLFRLKPGAGYNLDVYSTRDVADESVTNTLHSVPLILDTEWVLSKHWNLTVGAAWHVFGKSNLWVNGTEAGEASWDSYRPRIDISGPRFRLSADFLTF